MLQAHNKMSPSAAAADRVAWRVAPVPPHGGSHVNHRAMRCFVAYCSACERSEHAALQIIPLAQTFYFSGKSFYGMTQN